MDETARRRATIAANAAIAALTAFAWAQMTLGWGGEGGALSSLGLENLKYFTVLSNVFSGVVAAVWAVALARGGSRLPGALFTAKYLACVCVALTGLTVLCVFAPLYGAGGLYRGANLWFHGVLPAAAVAEFCLLDPPGPLPFSRTLLATVPMLAYGAAYYANILVNGVGTWPDTNDWYGFAAAGLQWAPLVFAAMALGTWAIAVALRAVRLRIARRRAA